MRKQETAEVTLKLPKPIMNLLRDQEKNLKNGINGYLEYNIIQSVGADIDNLECGVFKFDYDKPEEFIKRYNLNEILKDTMAGEFCQT